MAQQETLKTTPQRKAAIDRMIRVNQAGEFGAKRIYAGQLAVMGDRTPAARSIAHMAEQEERHLSAFDKMMAERGVRPTALYPIWNAAGFALGAVSAAISPEAAMACTVAIDTPARSATCCIVAMPPPLPARAVDTVVAVRGPLPLRTA